MGIKEFEDRIRNQQWNDGDEIEEWYSSTGEDSFVEIGTRLVFFGLSYKEALVFLGDCHMAVAGEYGD